MGEVMEDLIHHNSNEQDGSGLPSSFLMARSLAPIQARFLSSHWSVEPAHNRPPKPWLARLGKILASRTAAMDPLRNGVTNDTLLRSMKAVELIRAMESVDLPCQVVSSFLYVTSHDACHLRAVKHELRLSDSSSSRVSDWLSHTHRLKNRQGLGLIHKIPDPSSRRRKLLILTEK